MSNNLLTKWGSFPFISNLAAAFAPLAISLTLSVSTLFAAPTFTPAMPQTPQAKDSSENSDPEKLATSASNAQNNSDFKFAQQQWEALIKRHPNWPNIAIANLNLGICQFQQNQYGQAIEPLNAALAAGDTSLNIPKALLFLGFSQMKYGNQLSLKQTKDEREKGGIFLTTATRTLGKIVKEYPDYENADQALYFQGQAFYQLERYEDAVDAFQGLSNFEKPKFKLAAQYELGSAYQKLGKFHLALAAFEQYRDSLPKSDTLIIDEVDLQIAKLNMRLAQSAKTRLEPVEATELYKQAQQRLERFSAQPQSGLFAEANFNAAIVADELKEFSRAAELFQKSASVKDSPFAQQAAVMAGREWVRAKKFKTAIEILTPLAVADSKHGLQAAILLSNAYRNDAKADQAIELTQQWIKQTSTDAPLYVSLLMENAEAVYTHEPTKIGAAEHFLKIANEFPDSTSAPEALFNATASFWESYKTKNAIQTAQRLIQTWPNHPLVPEAQDILGDAYLVEEDFSSGEETYQSLISNFAQHPKHDHWALRVGWARYLDKRYADTESWLSEKVPDINAPKLVSEAWHWIGVSQYQQQKLEEAAKSLQKSIDASQHWARLDETMLALVQCQLSANRLADARLTAAKIASQFPDSLAVSESVFRIGETLYDQNEFADALIQYQSVIKEFPKSKFVPPALLGQGWCQLRTGQTDQAVSSLNTVIERFPKTASANQAQVALSVAQRKLGKSNQAIESLKRYLATSPDGPARESSQFELGLALVENKNWEDAEKTFRGLSKLPQDNPLADRVQYELGWVLEALQQPEFAAAQFQQLAQTWPNSPLAAEANFKVASYNYEQKKYQDAARFYDNVIAGKNATDDLKEKAFYKRAWANYKQKQFVSAAETFGKQVTSFPQGPLAAEGQFMLAQSWFEHQDYPRALAAYVAAKPIVMASNTTPLRLKWLTMINGAKSANQQKLWNQAIEFATPLTTSDADTEMQHSAWFEIGKARLGLDQANGALDAWQRASTSPNKIGALARVMKGDLLFKQKQFDQAIDEFKLVFYGYGGTQSEPEIQPLQAYAVYEAGRCNYERVSEASQRMKPKLIQESIKHFEYLIKNYPQQPLANEAKKQLDVLKQLTDQK